ncbi:MAG: C25 family cysteine peptidase [Chitinophagales bacterium]
MRRLLLATFFLFFVQKIYPQVYGNEWIQYDQTYFKFYIIEDGFYRIPHAVLAATNFPLSSVNGSQLQIFNRGSAIPIYVSNDGLLGMDDYVEFYAVHNDGILDSSLYADKGWQVNDHLSLFNDTATYFLTWSFQPVINHFVETPNIIENHPPKESFCWYTSAYTFGQPRSYSYNLSLGAVALSGQNFHNSDFSNCEGYTDNYFNKASKNYIVNTPYPFISGPSAQLKTWVVSWGFTDLHLTIALNGNTIYDVSDNGFIMRHLEVPVSNITVLTNPTSTFTYSTAATTSTTTDWGGVAWLEFRYPREFNFENKTRLPFSLSGTNAAQYIEINNFNENGATPVLYDFTNKLRMEAVVQNDTVKFVLPPSSQERQLQLVANDPSSVIQQVDSLEQITFINFFDASNQGNFIIISHPFFFQDSTGHNYIEDYKNFKNTIGYNAIVVNIRQLYDQFAWGIHEHPASIRKFTDFILDKWPTAQRHVFLIGKGIEYTNLWDAPTTRPLCYVPTFGTPGSDVLLTATGNSPAPRIPIGRIACLTPEEIGVYLAKAQLFESAQQNPFQTIANKGWMKNVMHLAGGANAQDQLTFQGFLNKYKSIVTDTVFGGNVYSFFKTSTDPIEYIVSTYIDSIISSGVSLITFYGHSSYNSFDFNLDRPEEYNNYGKYPVIFTNGCLIGNLFTTTHGISDDFVFAKDRGAIAFLAPSQFSVSTSLDLYSTNFYKNLSAKNYNESLGTLIAKTMNDVVTQSGADIDRAVAEQMLLNGDPSVKINTHPKPDYALESKFVSFDPPSVSAGLDSFFLQIVLYNIGQASSDSIYIDVKRTLPNGNEEFLYHHRIKAPYFKDTIRLSIKTEPNFAFGLNQFNIKADAGDSISIQGEIDELSELNNEITTTLFISSDDIVPVFPYEYSIVSEQGVTLKASTVDAFAKEKQYVFQVDTTADFISPLLQQKKIIQTGGVVNWKPSITLKDSTVYYWRTSIDTLYNNGFVWHNASFIYLQGSSPGWSQSHFFQLKSTIQPNANVELPDNRLFKFSDDIKTIGVYDAFTYYIGGPVPLDDPGYFINGVRISRVWDCMGYGVTMLFEVIDSVTGLQWINPNLGGITGLYNSIQCKPTPRSNFFYNTTYTNTDVGKFLDTVPDGDYLLMMSINDPNIRNWDTTMMKYFTDLNLTQITTIDEAVPYVAFLKKNDPDYPVYEVFGDTFNSIIDTNFAIQGNWDQGFIESPLIGPAVSWSSLHWKTHSLEAGTDSISLQLVGVGNDGLETILSDHIASNDTLLSGIDPVKYPYLKLHLFTTDTSQRTPVQLDYWRINYQPVPEAALNPALYFSAADTINQFLPFQLKVAVENVTPWDMDSLLMKYEATDAINGSHTYLRRYQPLAGNDTLHINYDFTTGSDIYAGLNYLFIEVNPGNDQPEQTHFNNIGIIDFNVTTDEVNPLLDVTFDGIHILDGDLVSAKPEIDMLLKDESKFLALNDTSLFDIYLIYPDGSKHNVIFDNLTAFFYPADSANLSKDNSAGVTLKKSFSIDGTYQLVVQGYDRSGNSSGDNTYRISFKIINKPMISNVLNYPNPFTTSTRFVFTLTGSEVPQFMKIQIMTISGRIIKEIFMNELGSIHIGNNITDYAWDGTDQYGDKLANGLYFYRVNAILNGKDIDHYDTSTDDYFKHGIGKMYLMR